MIITTRSPALPKAKYCPRVAADAHRKTPKNSCDLDLSAMTLKVNRILEAVKVHVRAVYQCSGLWVTNSALDFGQQL